MRARWDFPEQLVGRSDKRKHQNEDVYNNNTFIVKRANQWDSWCCLPWRKKYVIVRLDGWARQQKNVIDMAVREQGAKARLRVLHFGEELFATVGAAKHGYDALNMRNVFMKIPRKEGDVTEEGQWRKLVELRLQFIIALKFHQLHLQGAEDRGGAC